MILNELFGNPREVTPESQRKIFFIVTKKSALRSILNQFGDQISECGGSLVAPGHIWSLIKDLAYTSGGRAIAVAPPRMSNYGSGVRGDKNNVIGRLRNLQQEFPLAAERNRAKVDEEYLTLSEYRQKFKFESKQAERNFIAEMNGVVSLDTWCQLMFAHYSSDKMLSESVEQTTINDINLLRSFSADSVEVGQSYIPVPFMVVGPEIKLMDIAGNYPAQIPASMCELLSAGPNEYKFRVGDRVISYPDEKINGKMLMSIVICGSEDMYNQLRMIAILNELGHLPNFNDVNEEYSDASATTPDTDAMANKLNQAGANYAVHAQMDQDVQDRYAAQKPIGTVKLSGST